MYNKNILTEQDNEIRFNTCRQRNSTNLININKTNKNISGTSIYYQNVRGLRTKLRTLVCNVPLFDYDIVVFTETWLNASINSAELGMDNYVIYRLDRNHGGNGRGGSVLIAINKHIKSSNVKLNEQDNLEILTVKFKIKSRNFLISTVYIPPDSPASQYLKYTFLLDEMFQKFPKTNFILT